MPTLSYAPGVDDDEDEDQGFSSGLARDVQGDKQDAPDDADDAAGTSVQTPQATPAAAAATAPDVTPAGESNAPGDDPNAPPPIGALDPPKYVAPDRSGLQQWESKLQQDQKPIDRNDPSVKPKWWERLVAGVGSGMMAFGRNPDASAAGAAVLNRRYNNAVQQQQGQEQQDRTAIEAQQGIINGSDHDYERQLGNYNAQVLAQQRNATAADRQAQAQQRSAAVAPGTWKPDDPSNPLGPGSATTVGGKTLRLPTAPDDFLKSPAGVTAQRKDLATSLGVKPGTPDYLSIMTTGKPAQRIAQPRATEGEIRLSQARQAFIAEYGRPPKTLAELAKINAAANGKGAEDGSTTTITPQQWQGLVNQHDREYADAERNKATELKAATTDEERQQVEDKYNGIAQDLQDRWNQRYAQADPEGKYATGAAGETPPAAAGAASVARPAAQPAAGVPPPQALAGLKPGLVRTFRNGSRWTVDPKGNPIPVQGK